MGIAAGAVLGAVLGALAVGFGAALWGSLSLGLMTGSAIRGGMKGLGEGMLKGAGKGALVGGGIGAVGGLGMAAAGKERGGPVKAGSPYVVGEKRPELFIPSTSGNILPSVPHMATGTGFIQGDVNELVVEQRRSNDLAQRRMDQAEMHSKKAGRDVTGAFAQR